MAASDRPAENGETNGPVIHDRRRIDPLTGQGRHGKHAASKPAGTTGAGRPGGGGAARRAAQPTPAHRTRGRRLEPGVEATKEDEALKRREASELEAELA